jgi:hypothetical protein
MGRTLKLVGFAVAILASIATLTLTALHYREKAIFVTVYRHILQEKARRHRHHMPNDLLFLAQHQTTRFWRSDVDEDIMTALKAEFDTSGFTLCNERQASADTSQLRTNPLAYGPTNPTSDQRGEIIAVGPVSWSGVHAVEVDVSYYRGLLSSAHTTLALTQLNGIWRVTGEVIESVS